MDIDMDDRATGRRGGGHGVRYVELPVAHLGFPDDGTATAHQIHLDGHGTIEEAVHIYRQLFGIGENGLVTMTTTGHHATIDAKVDPTLVRTRHDPRLLSTRMVVHQ